MKVKELLNEQSQEQQVSVSKHPILFASFRTTNVLEAFQERQYGTLGLNKVKNEIDKLLKLHLSEIFNVEVHNTTINIRVKLENGDCDKLADSLYTILSDNSKEKITIDLIEVRYCPIEENLPFIIKFKQVRFLAVTNINLSLIGIHKKIDCENLVIGNGNQIKSGGLGLLQIKSLKYIEIIGNDNLQWLHIIDDHLHHDKDILECQEELISNGLREYAKL